MSVVLVAEDNPDGRESLVELLGDLGYPAHGVCCGQTALEFISHTRPGAVLTDLMMPHITGWQVAEYTAQHAIPTLVLTALSFPTDARIHGAPVLVKPYYITDILDWLEHHARLESLLCGRSIS